MNYSRWIAGPLAAFALVLVAPAPVAAQNVKAGVRSIVEGLNKWFDDIGRDRLLTIGAFTDDDGAVNVEFPRLVKDACAEAKPVIEVRRAQLTLTGRLKKSKPKEANEKVSLVVEIDLSERDGGKLETFVQRIGGDEALSFLSPTVEFPKDLPAAERERRLDQQLSEKSLAFLDGDVTLGAKDGKFGVEIRVRQGTSANSTPATPKDVEGQSFVTLVSPQEYIVRLHNRSDAETAVALTIDGLSMFAFASDGSTGSMIVIAKGQSVDIPGWYITNQQTDAFEIGAYASSAAAAKGLAAGSVGVVTARFHNSLPAGTKGAENDLATKRGRRIDQPYEEVKRAIGDVRAFVTVRYNRSAK